MLHDPSPFKLSPISQLQNLECASDFFTPSGKAFPHCPKSAKSCRSNHSTLSKLLFARTSKKLQRENHHMDINSTNINNKSPTAEFLEQLNKDIKDLNGKFQRYDENAMNIEQECTQMKKFSQMNDLLEVNDKLKTMTSIPEQKLPSVNFDCSKSYYKEYQDAIKLSQDMHTEFTRFMMTTDKTISKFLSELDVIFKNNTERMSIKQTLSFVENYAAHMQADIWGALARVTRFPNVLIQLHQEVRELLGLDDAFKQQLHLKDKRISELEDQLAASQQEAAQLKEEFAVSLESGRQSQKDVEEDKKEIKRLIRMDGEVAKMKEEEDLQVTDDAEEDFVSDEDGDEVSDEEGIGQFDWKTRVLLKKVKAGMDMLKRDFDSLTDFEKLFEGTQEVDDLEDQLKKPKKREAVVVVEQDRKEESEEEIKFLKVNFEKGVLETDEEDGYKKKLTRGLKERSINIIKEETNEGNQPSIILDERREKLSRLQQEGKENQFQFGNSVLKKRPLKFLEDDVEECVVSSRKIKKK